MLSCIFFIQNWISFSISSSVREVSVITSDFSANYLSVLMDEHLCQKDKICNHNVWTKEETWVEPNMPEYRTKKMRNLCFV